MIVAHKSQDGQDHHPMTTFVIDWLHQSRNAVELTCEAKVPANTKNHVRFGFTSSR
jgi:hypothetical protein